MAKPRSHGLTSAEAAKKSFGSKTIVNTSVNVTIANKKTEQNNLKDTKKYKCTACGQSWDTPKKFNKSKSPLFAGNDGYVNICADCRDSYYYSLVELYSGNEEKSIDRMCQVFDWFFHEEPLGASKQISEDRSRVADYANKLNLSQTVRKGSTYIDTIKLRADEDDNNVIETLDDVKDSKKAKLKSVKFFGAGFDEEDYPYLEDEYLDWTTRHECATKAQEEVFKQICYAQLDILKAKKKNQPTKDLTKTLQDLLATANLQPKQTKDNALADQNTFGTLIRKWENEKPIPEPDDEWKDVDGIAKYITIYFLGHLCKMMGIKNTYARMYEQEMSKYKVDKPEYEDDDEALFDAVFGGGLDDSE